MKVRFSEIFYSFQGEAEHAGTPTTWIRFFGCNLECNGFGQKDPTDPSTYKLPFLDLDLIDVKRVEDLPVWEYGCDSSYSWSKKYKHLAQDTDPQGAADLLESKLPHGKFTHPRTGQENMLAFTGGEPMLQQKQMKAIVNEFVIRGNIPKLVTVETNATKKLNPELAEWLNTYYHDMGGQWHWAMSPKLLQTSGEVGKVNLDIIMSYLEGVPQSTGILKFVCNGTEDSWKEIEDFVTELNSYYKNVADKIKKPDIWIMPVGATVEGQELVAADIAIEAMNRGYKVATRNHAYVFGNQIGT
jgi:7-carboxy-7-deazaguanine synthase